MDENRRNMLVVYSFIGVLQVVPKFASVSYSK